MSFNHTVKKFGLVFNSSRAITLKEEGSYDFSLEEVNIYTPDTAAALIEKLFDASKLTQENCWLITLNEKRIATAVFLLSVGSIKSNVLQIRDIFSRAFLAGASSIILLHNHPDGSLVPSQNDVFATNDIKKAGELLDVELDDHIIIGNSNDWRSIL